MPRVVLASTSRYRRELMGRLGVEVTCVAPDYDEDAARAALAHASPAAIAVAHARGKALSVARSRPDEIVIGSDQVIACDGAVLHKPVTPERARAQLAALAGRTHESFTAVAVVLGDRVEEALDVHRLTMRPLTARQIRAYVDRDAPLDCAGSYRVESLGIALFDRVEGADFTAVVGLPLTRVAALLASFGADPLGE